MLLTLPNPKADRLAKLLQPIPIAVFRVSIYPLTSIDANGRFYGEIGHKLFATAAEAFGHRRMMYWQYNDIAPIVQLQYKGEIYCLDDRASEVGTCAFLWDAQGNRSGEVCDKSALEAHNALARIVTMYGFASEFPIS